MWNETPKEEGVKDSLYFIEFFATYFSNQKVYKEIAECSNLNNSIFDPNPIVKIQYCWGDARRENILFNGSEISGFIDYCAMRKDCREVDISRMISSFGGDDYLMWTNALNAYSEISQINYLDCRKLDILGTIVSLYRWLNWFQKPIPDEMLKPAKQRCTEIFQRIEKWKERC